jgi:hypothetical protein
VAAGFEYPLEQQFRLGGLFPEHVDLKHLGKHEVVRQVVQALEQGNKAVVVFLQVVEVEHLIYVVFVQELLLLYFAE